MSVSAYDEGEVLKVTACSFELNAQVMLAFRLDVWEVQRLSISLHKDDTCNKHILCTAKSEKGVSIQ